MARAASRREFAYAEAVNPSLRRRWYLRRILSDRPHAAEIRAFDAAPYLLSRQQADDQEVLRLLRRHIRRRQVLALISTLASALLLAAALVLIVLLVREGRLTLPEAGAAAIAARLLGGQLGGVFSSFATLIEAGPFLEDFIDVHSRSRPRGPARHRAGSHRGAARGRRHLPLRRSLQNLPYARSAWPCIPARS